MHRALLVVTAASAATKTRTWRTLRLYHINPLRFDADDIADKDLGDAAGDAFFDISSITNYYACAPGSRRAPGVVCANAETSGPDIGVTEVEVEVDGAFGPYGTCNICGSDGRSPLNHSQTCEPGNYVCNCENGKFPPTTLPCTTQMGRENTSLFLGKEGIGGFCNGRASSAAACAAASAADKLQGFWSVWKSTSASGAPDNSSRSHFSARTRSRPLNRAATSPRRRADVASITWRP